MKRILITGFDPFNQESINTSFEALKGLPDIINNTEIIKKELPTQYNTSFDVLKTLIQEFSPEVVICVGQASSRSEITPERIAINIDDAIVPDNKGALHIDKIIIEDGPQAYFSKLPIKKIVEALQYEKISASVSNTCGTYVCNHIMYQLLHYIESSNSKLVGGFIHVPSHLNGFLSLEEITKGLELALKVVINERLDKL